MMARSQFPIAWLVLAALLWSQVAAFLIQLPDAGRAEGVAHLRGSNFVATDVYTGNVFLVDVESKLVTTVVRAPPGRIGIGLYATDSYIFVAGAGPAGFAGDFFDPPPVPTLYAYKVSSGADAAVCEIPSGGFINDVIADSDYAYYTDSLRPVIYRLALSSMAACNITRIPLPPDSFSADGFNANGIVTFNGGLIVANGSAQAIFFVDLVNGNKVTPIVPEGTIPNVDGLYITPSPVGSLLYVVQNLLNKISVWRVNAVSRSVNVRKIGEIVRPKQFFIPTTVAVADKYLVAANFDFATPFVLPPVKNFTLFVLPLIS